jgi:hypothetical protein
MLTTITLTVAESKRLIAKGVRALGYVDRALEDGIVAVAKGTTNAYVAEELLRRKIDKKHYVSGRTFPHNSEPFEADASLPDVVIRRGEVTEDLSAVDAVKEMGPGDVFIKGANAINPALNQAGLLIGHPEGGTLGATLGTLVARRAHLLVPVGLEKTVPADLELVSQRIKNEPARGPIWGLWPFTAHIFTEVEALRELTGVEAIPIAAGGIGGAEGAVRLLISGSSEQLDDISALLNRVWGEQPFGTT